MAGTREDPVIFKFTSKASVKLSQLRYITFTIVGIALLWPWNCFLSASAYYGERFATTPLLIKIYSSTMMSTSCITSTLFNYYLSQKQSANYTKRTYMGLLLTVFIFLVMAASCISFTTIKDTPFFIGLMLMVFFSAISTALAQNGTMATVNVLGGIYANAVMVGQALAGVLPSIALILSVLLVKERESGSVEVQKNYGVAVYYFTASIISVVALSLLVLNQKYKELAVFTRLDDLAENDANDLDEDEEELTNEHVPFSLLWSKLKLIVTTIFLTFSITLIFPVFASIVELNNEGHWFNQKNVFIPFIYLVWNLGDLLGRVLCGVKWSKMLIKDPRVLIIYALGRLLFIPLFFTCNLHKEAVIKSDTWYILLQLLFGVSNGQLCTSCFMIVRDYCDTDAEREAAGGFTSVFLSVGLSVGALLSYVLVIIIN